MEASVISFGSINFDIQVRSERWPEAGETLIAQELLTLGGGKGANVALLARRLGTPSSLVGCVGSDYFAERALEALRDSGVDLTHVSATPNAPTGLALVVGQPDGDKVIFLAPNANEVCAEASERSASNAIGAAHEDSILVVDLEVPQTAVVGAMREARERGMATVLDPSPANRVNDELLRQTSYLTPNASEAAMLVGFAVDGIEAASAAAKELAARGAMNVLVKLHDGGCVVRTDQRTFLVRVPRIEPVDTTGAGDAFAGALAVAALERRGMEQCAQFACAAAQCAVAAYGATTSYPDRDAVEAKVPALTCEPLSDA